MARPRTKYPWFHLGIVNDQEYDKFMDNNPNVIFNLLGEKTRPHKPGTSIPLPPGTCLTDPRLPYPDKLYKNDKNAHRKTLLQREQDIQKQLKDANGPDKDDLEQKLQDCRRQMEIVKRDIKTFGPSASFATVDGNDHPFIVLEEYDDCVELALAKTLECPKEGKKGEEYISAPEITEPCPPMDPVLKDGKVYRRQCVEGWYTLMVPKKWLYDSKSLKIMQGGNPLEQCYPEPTLTAKSLKQVKTAINNCSYDNKGTRIKLDFGVQNADPKDLDVSRYKEDPLTQILRIGFDRMRDASRTISKQDAQPQASQEKPSTATPAMQEPPKEPITAKTPQPAPTPAAPATVKPAPAAKKPAPAKTAANPYVVQDGVLTKYTGNDKHVVIPEGVTEIGPNVFGLHREIEQVTIPDTVKAIGRKAFAGCTKLAQITMPEAVERIDDLAFFHCINLQQTDIRNPKAEISDTAFKDCKQLVQSSKNVPAEPFTGHLEQDGHSFEVQDGRITKYNGPGGNVAIPDRPDILAIGSNAFQKNKHITGITLPSNIRTIEPKAFSHCSSLTRVHVPESVDEIGDDAFSGCKGLKVASLPRELKLMGRAIFADCDKLSHAALPDNLKEIPSCTFIRCSSLERVALPAGLLSIKDSAFYGCSSLTEIDIPKSVAGLGDGAFNNCRKLMAVYMPGPITDTSRSFNCCPFNRTVRRMSKADAEKRDSIKSKAAQAVADYVKNHPEDDTNGPKR